MSKLNDWLTRIADIQIGINVPGLPNPYVLRAEPYQPTDAASMECPFFVNEIYGGASGDTNLCGQQYRNTVVNMMLCVQRYEASTNLKYGIENTLEWADAVTTTFAQHIRLSAPAKYILSSTNATPIKITTATPHRYTTGDQVTVAGHAVNTNANGTWNATVVDEVNLTLDTSIGNGAGAKTGTTRLTQPGDLPNIVTAIITGWNLVPYAYGSTVQNEPNYLALRFVLEVREMYVTAITG